LQQRQQIVQLLYKSVYYQINHYHEATKVKHCATTEHLSATAVHPQCNRSAAAVQPQRNRSATAVQPQYNRSATAVRQPTTRHQRPSAITTAILFFM